MPAQTTAPDAFLNDVDHDDVGLSDSAMDSLARFLLENFSLVDDADSGQ